MCAHSLFDLLTHLLCYSAPAEPLAAFRGRKMRKRGREGRNKKGWKGLERK